MGRSTVLLKNEEVDRYCTDIGQHLLFQQHFPIICSVYFDARGHEYEVGSTQLIHTNLQIPWRTLWKLSECATTDPLQCSFSFPFLFFVPVSMRKGDEGDISNSLCNLHLNFVINWQSDILFVTSHVEYIVLIWKCLFVTTVISQGSVATHLRFGGQCHSQFAANFLMNSTMKKFRKSVNICQSYGQKYRGPFLLTHSVLCNNVMCT